MSRPPPTLVVVPAKDPTNAKERLAGVLTPPERRDLALALLENTLGVLRAVPSRPTVMVVTDSDEVESRARAAGAEVLREAEAAGETRAVEEAARRAAARGFTRLAVLPADLADPDPAEIERLLALDLPPPSVVLVPATGDDGTNAIMTAPPNALPFRFGKRSFPEYRERAAAAGLRCEILRLPSLVLDIDTPEDLRTLVLRPGRGGAGRFLEERRIRERLDPRALADAVRKLMTE